MENVALRLLKLLAGGNGGGRKFKQKKGTEVEKRRYVIIGLG